MNLYCIKVTGQYDNFIYAYTRQNNVSELAKYLNDRVTKYPKETIYSVSLVEGYDSERDGIRVLSDHEYNIQYFYETYEMRLMQHYREQHAV